MRRRLPWISFPFVLLAAWIAFIWWGHELFKRHATQHHCLSNSDKAALPHASALRAMPVNWLIADADLQWAGTEPHTSLKGRYVACELHQGGLVVEQDTREVPVLVGAKGKTPYMLPLKSPAGINAEVRIEIFAEVGPPLVNDARVLATVCADHCSAVIEVTPVEGDRLSHQKIEDMTVLPRQ